MILECCYTWMPIDCSLCLRKCVYLFQISRILFWSCVMYAYKYSRHRLTSKCWSSRKILDSFLWIDVKYPRKLMSEKVWWSLKNVCFSKKGRKEEVRKTDEKTKSWKVPMTTAKYHHSLNHSTEHETRLGSNIICSIDFSLLGWIIFPVPLTLIQPVPVSRK